MHRVPHFTINTPSKGTQHSTSNAKAPQKASSSQFDSSDGDEYSSFDETELEILNNLLEAHSPTPSAPSVLTPGLSEQKKLQLTPPAQANPEHSPPLYPQLPRTQRGTGLQSFPEGLLYPSLKRPRTPAQDQDSEEGRFDDAEEDVDDDDNFVEASEHLLIQPRPLWQSTRKQDNGDASELAVQYEHHITTAPLPVSPLLSVLPSLITADSPYSRFRSMNRGLSVTDLLSNTWCEKQFEYYLVRGKKRTTPAMRKGTKIHKKLEKEVHETVPVKVISPEDRWGLKLLNIIQGLRTLRELGMTRELPVFATVKGMFVQGVIDEISYEKPVECINVVGGSSTEEQSSEVEVKPKRKGRKKKEEKIEKEQSLVTDFMSSSQSTNPRDKPRIAHISDYKTRLAASLPPITQFRSTELQLMLYHYLLTSMASSVDAATQLYPRPGEGPLTNAPTPVNNLFSQLFEARNLKPYAPFSDDFLAQMVPLLDESDSEADSDCPQLSSHVIKFPTVSNLLANPTLSGLLHLLSVSFSLSIPTLSRTLAVSYRWQKDSSLLATKVVEYDDQRLENHLVDVLQWWQGQRETVGVPIEEAWKCRSCDFADECEWRLGKIDELKVEKEVEKEKNIGKGKGKGRGKGKGKERAV